MAIGSRDDSYLKVKRTIHGDTGTAFVGPDATRLFQATILKTALRTYANTGMKLNRMYTPSNMLKAASRITGKTYPRRAYGTAADDLEIWCNNMRAALPVVEG